MKSLFRALSVVCVLSLAAACGGPTDDQSSTDDLSSSFDPVAQFAAVKKAAAPYASNIVGVTLTGARQAEASTTKSSCTSFTWVWTVMGDNREFVDVQLNSQSAKVLRHGQRYLFAGEATFDPGSVLVNGQDLMALSAQLKMGQPTAITLGSTLAAELTGPRWSVTYPKGGYMTIDGVTGKETP